jgi:hypothetical protein
MALFDSFIIQPGDNPADPNSIIRRRKMAEELMKQGMDGSPIRSPWQGVNRVAQALTGAYDERIADQQEGANNKWNSEALASLLGGGSSGSAPAAAAPAPAPASGGGTVAPEDLAPLIQKASAQTGIPVPVLTAQIKQESGFNPNAVGKAGEIGLMQIMPSTAKQPGFGMQGIDPAALRDPETNIMFGANYLKARGGKVDYNDQSNVAKALAAYNGGGDPNYVQNVTRFMPGQGGQQQPVQVAQNGPASGLMGLGGGGQAQGGPNPNDLLRIIADPRASAGLKQAAQAKLQMMQKDPMQDLQRQQLQLQIQDAQRKAGRAPLEDEAMRLDIEAKRKGLKDKPMSVGSDSRLVDPETGRVILPPDGSKAPTTHVIKQADGSEVAVQWDAKESRWVPLDAPQGGNAVKPLAKPPTEAQSKDLGFYTRGSEALKNLQPYEKALASAPQAVAGSVPIVGNALVSKEYQLGQQAGREFLAAMLRKDSGGAITKEEEQNYGRMYLPQPGDAPEVMEQKRVARSRAMEAIKLGLGPQEVLLQSLPQNVRGGQQAAPAPNEGWREISPGIRVREVK